MDLDKIKRAAKAMVGVLERTPTIQAPWLEINNKAQVVFLKLESLQKTSSFKARGALIKLLSLSPDQRRQGVIAMSAGNHAQGVALHANRMGIPATIVMPENTPFSKVERTEAFGAKVILFGKTLSESEIRTKELIQEQGLTLIHPYDDPEIITGQGTVALEMLEDWPMIDTLVIPIGGGGLITGMSIAAKALNPSIKIYGVQMSYCPSMVQALYPERHCVAEESETLPLSEGILVKKPGGIAVKTLRSYLEDILIVDDSHVEDAIAFLAGKGKIISEGAGAAGVAAFIANPNLFEGKKVGTVICGGNIDSRLLSSILMRSLVHQGKLIQIEIQAPDIPGSLAQITKIIGDAGGNIYELTHQRSFSRLTAKMASIDVILETHGMSHALEIISRLHAVGFPTTFWE